MIFEFKDAFFACRKANFLEIDGRCRQIHLPHATFSIAQSLHRSHSTDDMCMYIGSRRVVRRNTFRHPRVMSHLLMHATLGTSSPSLSSTSPVLLSSSSPNPDLLSTYSIIHREDPRQDLRNSTLPQVMSPRGSSSTGF